jgi:uncharacterized membrane protein
MQHKEFLDQLDDAQVIKAISEAETKSSGEIRVFVSKQKPVTGEETLKLAQQTFTKLGMAATKYRNGVLLFFCPLTQQFAIVGDAGIHEKCGAGFWSEISQEMSQLLRQGNFTAAVIAGIHKAGAALVQNFPRDPDDRNELPNAVERD